MPDWAPTHRRRAFALGGVALGHWLQGKQAREAAAERLRHESDKDLYDRAMREHEHASKYVERPGCCDQ